MPLSLWIRLTAPEIHKLRFGDPITPEEGYQYTRVMPMDETRAKYHNGFLTLSLSETVLEDLARGMEQLLPVESESVADLAVYGSTPMTMCQFAVDGTGRLDVETTEYGEQQPREPLTRV